MFLDPSLPWFSAPKFCKIDGTAQAHDLRVSWVDVDIETWTRSQPSVQYGTTPKPQAVRKSPKTFWIRLPTLLPDREAAQAYSTILRMPDFREVKNIVFDLRGNGGGDSRWIDPFIKAAMNATEAREYDTEKAKLESMTVKYRVSSTNLARIRGVVTDPATGEVDTDMAALATDLEKALAKDEPLLEHQREDHPLPRIKPVVETQRRFFAITDGWCVSSCLVMLDRLKVLKNFVHLGWPTLADTGYLQINQLPLPKHAGMADIDLTLMYPMAWFDRRYRGDNVPYTPDHSFAGEPSDQLGLETWALELIESAFYGDATPPTITIEFTNT